MFDSNLILQPFQLNETIRLKNRIVMAPMTRNMANDDFSPTQEMVNYYARRADAGLIITEGAVISPDGRGYSNTPGIYTRQHVDGWKRVTHAVHEKKGKIFLQIWHVGRVSHPVFLDGALPVSPSETVMAGKIHRIEGLYYGKSRALSIDEIKTLINKYAQAAARAMEAGFDGIEIHGANGYLIDQFLHYHTNKRNDVYGLEPKNLARFALEVVEACIAEIGNQRVGLRLSPGTYLNEIVGDTRDANVFQYLLRQLTEKKIAYLHTGNFDDTALFPELGNKTMTEFMRIHFGGKLIASGGYIVQQANQQILENKFDLVALGRPFIANPDLIERIKTASELKSYEATMLETLF
ncbi:NADH-dependent flavin oxidoreductase, Oye family [Legionella lansingensis]|uniref:NADH-dependent flavin oxidoreductase, Oye family n=1 Tax=Legionella lansingensis TaxID=45067 RepID=A0A0W0VSK2_9GAMM|nr:alkene reductase [Legionella lansingensis]KTD22997.1 NADH-dependent flavin oxidoreductase, Oye family [Legionella lansingensis]SNV51287.1 NADH-dependent flavin oxidoreductase, Oye family [Legionella lansingensis]